MIGRAGVGVDNVDVRAATRRGIVVCNAPESNIVSAAEHTIALLLALARNIPQAHARAARRPLGALRASAASSSPARRSGVLGFGRIGQLVAARARGLGMRVDRLRPVRDAPSASASSASTQAATIEEVLGRRRLRHAAPAR